MIDLISRLWNDEAGSIVATEYLMLGTIVGAGSAAGMASMRDSINDEYKEFGNSLREVRQSYTVPGHKTGNASAGGSAAVSAGHGAATDPLAAPAAPLTGQQIQFTAPTP